MVHHLQQNNIGYICSTQQCLDGYADKTALRILDASNIQTDLSFRDLDFESNRVANILENLGFHSGDILFTFLQKSPEQFCTFIGALKKKIICAPLFANLGDTALFDRLAETRAKGLVTRKSALKKLDRISAGLPDLEVVIVVDLVEHRNNKVLSYQQLLKTASADFETPPTPAETPSVLHYTSGSTGKPKGVLHCHRSLTTQRDTGRQILQLTTDDVYWCTADQGWVTGTTYGIIAPWSLGVSQFQYAGAFNAERWLRLLSEQRVSVWYTAPTALRMLMRAVPQLPPDLDLSALRAIYSVGEPLNPEVIAWAESTFGKKIYDTWFQTETGAIMIANRPGLPIRRGSMGCPSEGISAAVLAPDGQPLPPGKEGMLAVESGWASMFTGYLKNQSAYEQKFKGGYYLSGDIALQDDDGYFWFKGRDDDIINTGGHLISPFEIESILLERGEVAESAVIGVPDELLYEKIIVFVKASTATVPDKELEITLRQWISNRLSTIATPAEILFVDDIPKNNSGKIMRRVLKSEFLGQDAGDMSTLENENE